MTRPAPLAVYDIREMQDWARVVSDQDFHGRLLAWMREQNLDPHITYRLEIHLVDSPSARVYEYARNEEKHLYCGVDHDHRGDEGRCEIDKREPYEVPVTSLPPTSPATPEGTS